MPQEITPKGQEDGVLTVEELHKIYGKRRRKSRDGKKKYASKRLFACALLGFLACAALLIMTFVSYARSASVIGTRRFYEGNTDIFRFILERIRYIEKIGTALNGQDEEAVLEAFGVIQSGVALLFAILTATVFLVYIILAAVRFAHKKDTVACALVGMVKWCFVSCVIYPFFVNTSGGSGGAFYSVGFAPGIGTVVGICLGLATLLACSVLMKTEHKRAEKMRKKQWGSVLIVALFCTCGSGICYALPLQSVFLYLLSSSLVSVAGKAAGGSVSINGIAFLILNFVLFVFSVAAYRLLLGGAEKHWKSLVSPSAFQKNFGPYAKIRRHKQRVGPLFAPAILSALSLVCACVLRVPRIGLGWDVQLIAPLIAMTVVCIAGMVVYIIWNKRADKTCGESFIKKPSLSK